MDRDSGKINLKPIIILVILLVLPGFLYYMLTLKGENRYKPLPVFGEKILTGTFHSKRGKQIADTLFHQVKGFEFINQNGDVISDTTYKNFIKVVNFYYRGCDGGCKRVLYAMSRADSNYVENELVKFLSINVATEIIDSLQITAAYYHAKAGKWDFLLGKQAEINTIVQQGFLVDGGKENNEIIVSNKIVLLDKDNRIRGFYEGTFKPDLDRLNDEIKVLIVEQLRNQEDFKN